MGYYRGLCNLKDKVQVIGLGYRILLLLLPWVILQLFTLKILISVCPFFKSAWSRVQNVTCTLYDFEGLLLEKYRVVDPSVHDVTESWSLEYNKVQHVIYTDYIKVASISSNAFLNPEEAFLWEALAHHELDAFHLFQLLLVIFRRQLRS